MKCFSHSAISRADKSTFFAAAVPLQEQSSLGRVTDWKCHTRWLYYVVLYSVLANIPFWAASRGLGLLPIGWFCIEYAGVGLLALFVPRIVAAALLLIAMAADLISATGKTYYLAPLECLNNLGSLQELPGRRFGVVVVVGVLMGGIGALATAFPADKVRGRYRWYAMMALLTFAIVTTSGDYLSVVRQTGRWTNPFQASRPGDANKFSEFSNLWLGRYPTVRLGRNQVLFGATRGSGDAALRASLPIRSTAALTLQSLGIDRIGSPQQKPNVVIVLLESWGLDSDASVRDALIHSYTQPDITSKYEVSQGTVAFFGSTVGGESRELCGRSIGTGIVNVSAEGLQGCLPDRLASLGYRTIALHGMSGHMFNRSTWYSSIGFQEQWFRDRFRQAGLPDCIGAFVGTCDAAIADWIGHRLEVREASPDFAYWVTLNSHLPLPIPAALREGASCSVSPLLSSQPALCSWYQLVANVHESVARLAMGKLGRPTVFVIVGDHAPPFANPVLRGQFSSTEVPYIVLAPRQDRIATNIVRLPGRRNAAVMR